MIKMFIDNEEVVSDREFAINEEMLSASSTILNNCYPKSWELNKDYISNFYYPKDYSKFLLGEGEFEHGNAEYGVLNVSGETFIQYETNVEKEWNSFNVYGNTMQETRSGKNLLKYPYFATLPTTQAGVTWNDDNGKIIASGTATGYSGFTLESNISVKANTNYRFYIVGTQTNVSIDITGSGLGINIPTTSLNNNGYIFNTGNATTITINVKRQTNSSVNANFYPMLVIGTDTSTDYEPYGTMPSPDYPSELVSVGYENLLKNTATTQTINGITFIKNEDGTITANGTATANSQLLLIRENNEYGNMYLSGCPSGGGSNYFINLSYLNENNVWQREQHETGNGLLITNSYPKIAVSLFIKSGFSCDNLVFKPMITKGTQVHSYIPYGKYGIEVKTRNANLFDINKNYYYGANTTSTVSDNTLTINGKWFAYQLYDLKPNTNYVLTLKKEIIQNAPNTGLIRIFGGTNSNNIINQVNSNVVRFNTGEYNQVGILFFASSNGTDTGIIKLSEIMLNEGTISLDYRTGQANAYLYTLDNPLRSIGDTKDLLYIKNGMLYVERKIGSKVLNGTENWYRTGATRLSYVNYTEISSLDNNNVNVKSNYFKGVGWNNRYTNIGTIAVDPSSVVLTFEDNKFSSVDQLKTWLSTHNTEVQYILAEPYTEVIGQFDIPYSYEGINNTTFDTGIDTEETIYYYWKNFNVLFAGIVKNSGDISLNPRYPHYCSLQILDYKTFLSESNTLDFVIANKTVKEAINMVVNAVANYGFIIGDINISGADDIIGAYSTLNKSAYDVLQYLANISGSRWRARYVNSSTMAIDFYDPDTLPQAEDIEYTKEYWENNNIVDMTFNYGTRDYRNKQILLSDEVYANINYDETLISNGYGNTFTVQNNIGLVVSVIVNNQEKTVGTNNDKQMGIDADFYYTPGKNIIESNMIYPASTLIHLTYQPLVKGRQIVYNNSEVDRISRQTDTEGVIARYETRNDILSSDELEKIAQTYIEYKGKAEVILTLKTQNKDLYNIGEVVYFNAPIDELKQNYMVKTKQIEYVVINDIINLFYIYEMTSSFNSEKAINYFDNQRNKASGNIADGESITRNIDIETGVGIIWTEGSVSSTSVTVTGDNLLNSALNSPFVE